MSDHTPNNAKDIKAMNMAMKLSLYIGFFMLAIKVTAYGVTQSSAILSDAAESVVHVFAVAFASYALYLSQKPANREYPYGHDKIAFVSSGVEGGMICIAAIFIIYDAINKWIHGLAIYHLDWGLGLTGLALIINGGLGGYLIYLGKTHKSIILEANGKHVMTDAITSIGAIIGLSLSLLTGQLFWDPIFALLVAGNILWAGLGLVKKSFLGLLDYADPQIRQELNDILQPATQERGLQYHQLRYRDTGNSLSIEMHLLFPDHISIKKAHQLATEIESIVENSLSHKAQVLSHLEPLQSHQELHPDPSFSQPH